METLAYIAVKYGIDLADDRMPIEISGIGRKDLAMLFAELGFLRGAEIGVESGEYSEILCRSIPGIEFYGIDAWAAYDGYRAHVSQAEVDGFYHTALERLRPYNARLMRRYSMDAVREFQDGELDFVYIDGCHNFESVTADIAGWGKKVRVGGIISGHDYIRYRRRNAVHVCQVVDGWTSAYKIKPWFLAGASVSPPGVIRDVARSWFWVKPVPQKKGKTFKE